MLNVLLESSAPRTRRVGSTITSALLHAALIAGAVELTLPELVDARGRDRIDSTRIDYVIAPPPPPAAVPRPRHHDAALLPPTGPVVPTIAVPEVVPVGLPPIDLGRAIPVEQIVIGGPGIPTASPIGGGASLLSGGDGSAIDEHLVDRAPRLLGRALEPRYPAALRDAGVQGRVVVQFVVDTLGRAELGELQVVETAHAQFIESVRSALARYRFTVGEAGGRKVRTRVQIPFDFMLTR